MQLLPRQKNSNNQGSLKRTKFEQKSLYDDLANIIGDLLGWTPNGMKVHDFNRDGLVVLGPKARTKWIFALTVQHTDGSDWR